MSFLSKEGRKIREISTYHASDLKPSEYILESLDCGIYNKYTFRSDEKFNEFIKRLEPSILCWLRYHSDSDNNVTSTIAINESLYGRSNILYMIITDVKDYYGDPTPSIDPRIVVYASTKDLTVYAHNSYTIP